MNVRFERVWQADADADTKSDEDADNANADYGYAEHGHADDGHADDGHAEHANADHANADHGQADSYSDDGYADKGTDGRRGRLDFDAASVRRQLDVELLGALQQHWQSVLHPGSWLAAAWAAHTSYWSPSVPKPNHRDVRPLPITSRITRTHSPLTLTPIHTAAKHLLARNATLFSLAAAKAR